MSSAGILEVGSRLRCFAAAAVAADAAAVHHRCCIVDLDKTWFLYTLE